MATITGDNSADVLTGTGLRDVLRGLGGADLLRGVGGNDLLDGGLGNDALDGGLGADVMIGGAGNDIYVVNSLRDRIVEFAGGGTDTIRSLISFSLGATPLVENLALIGAADTSGTGTDIANVITGNNGKNILRGLAGNDALSGGGGDDRLDGGAGGDVMRGGPGSDEYRVDAADTVIELPGGGQADRIESLFSFNLMTTPQVEHLTLVGSGPLSGTGNDLGNTIIGTSSANVLSGGTGNDVLVGGLGADVLTGGPGADIFRYRSVADSPGGVAPFVADSLDFAKGSDKIDLRAIDADVTNGPADSAFSFIGMNPFSGPGQVRYSILILVDVSIVTIQANVDGNPATDEFNVRFEVLGGPVPTLNANDFVL
jgi:Ca2+-binding RTX toxin-like protein